MSSFMDRTWKKRKLFSLVKKGYPRNFENFNVYKRFQLLFWYYQYFVKENIVKLGINWKLEVHHQVYENIFAFVFDFANDQKNSEIAKVVLTFNTNRSSFESQYWPYLRLKRNWVTGKKSDEELQKKSTKIEMSKKWL